MKNYLYQWFRKGLGLIRLIFGHLATTSVADYQYWSKKTDKSLLEIAIEWFIDEVLVTCLIGLMLSLALNGRLNWFQCAVSYWLMFKVIKSWRGDK